MLSLTVSWLMLVLLVLSFGFPLSEGAAESLVHNFLERTPNMSREVYTNPILRGGFPDPSITQVGDDFYMVSSSFEYFPGLPIHHSKDLVNWDLIGYGLHRADQVDKRWGINLVSTKQDDGLQAATIRYHDGTFYIVCTSTWNPETGPGNLTSFVITASQARGPWSHPHVVKDATGIDPDLFFDDDGKVFYTANEAVQDPQWSGQARIWLRQINLTDFQLFGPKHELTRGACGGVWVEGPHIYKHDGRYYLTTAEGGTGPHHAVMVAVSDNITGPYFNNPRNPILTMRHTSYSSWVNRVGHSDLHRLSDGRWVIVALGVRGDVIQQWGSKRAPPMTMVGTSNMGRESHLLPVAWESDMVDNSPYVWPVVSPETGRLEREYPLPLQGTVWRQINVFKDDFDAPDLDLQWNFRRLPVEGSYSLSARPGHLRLYSQPEVLAPRARCSLLGVRQLESSFKYSASLEFAPQVDGVEAGLMLFQKDDLYAKFVVARSGASWDLKVVYAATRKKPRTLASRELSNYAGKIRLKVEATRGKYQYSYALDDNSSDADSVLFLTTGDDLLLYAGYTGNYLGLYSTSNGRGSSDFADVDWVHHEAQPLQRGGSIHLV